MNDTTAPPDLDVIIVGAGLSGISAAWHLQTRRPGTRYTILEARDATGGTWDLFRYPGIRSDSDMYTLGYSFRPWREAKAIADGPSILAYIRDTAREGGIDRHIRLGHKVLRATWSSADARWTVTARTGDGTEVVLTARFLYLCAGYYDTEQGYTPDFPGRERFKGRVVHPQQWTPDVDYDGKQVVVIGSGATAVTLVPELARRAAHVTMLQRSPTYVMSLPARDAVANWLRTHLPASLAYGLVRWKNVTVSMAFFAFCRQFPDRAKAYILSEVNRLAGGSVDVRTHFNPTYKPWDQRLCLVPDGDLFEALKSGRASVVTDAIETFTETGIALRSGRTLPADVIVTATGLVLKFLGGMALTVDDTPVAASSTLVYKGMMLRDVPNLAFAVGYTNASWTLKCDLTAEYVCRVLHHMDSHRVTVATPRQRDASITPQPLLDFTSGYVQRAAGSMPSQGSAAPWKLYQNYVLDLLTLRHAPLEDGSLEFSTPGG